MSHNRTSFIDLCLDGRAFVDEIDDYIDLWHEGGTDISLHEFLGMTRPEYALWVEKPESIKFILFAKKNKRPIDDFRSMSDNLRLAARADSPEDAEEMIEWLKSTGRLEG